MLLQVIFGSRAIHLSSVSWIGAALFIPAIFTLRRFKWNPIFVMLACGLLSLLLGILGLA